jgi:myo-inositol 2-dehydrogenase/D-chiro-inositol 1-dehydrogenase
MDHFHFFMDRFGPAFRAELEAFFRCVAEGSEPSPGVADAMESLKISVAATKSWKEGRPVKVSEVAL